MPLSPVVPMPKGRFFGMLGLLFSLYSGTRHRRIPLCPPLVWDIKWPFAWKKYCEGYIPTLPPGSIGGHPAARRMPLPHHTSTVTDRAISVALGVYGNASPAPVRQYDYGLMLHIGVYGIALWIHPVIMHNAQLINAIQEQID